MSHLNDHIGEGRSVSCPVSGCKHVFTKKSPFTSHMCGKHLNAPLMVLMTYRETRLQTPNIIASTDDSENTHEAMPTASAASDMPDSLISEACVSFTLNCKDSCLFLPLLCRLLLRKCKMCTS